MVEHPRKHQWSSYLHNAQGETDELVTPHRLYKRLGRNREERQAAYRALFKGRLDERALEEIRAATNKGWALGGERFKQEIESLTQRRAVPLPRGRKKAEVEVIEK